MAKTKDVRDRSHDDSVVELFQANPAVAVELLNDILADGEQGELLIVLRQMAKAFGGVPAVAEKAKLNQTQLYRTLSAQGNPALNTLASILKVMGLRLAVQPVKAKPVARRTGTRSRRA
jgi:probable addiction module antidote protein